jgi:Flp pilus assembly protein TadD
MPQHERIPGQATFSDAWVITAAAKQHETRIWMLNVRLVVWTAVIIALVAPSLYAVHTVQVRRNAGILFERAEAFERQGDLKAAARALFQYLQFHPDDGPARVLLAEVFDKTANTHVAKERATEHYYTALSYFHDRRDLRSRLAELLLELNRPKDAEPECLRVLFGTSLPSRVQMMAGIGAYQDGPHAAELTAANPDAVSALRTLAKACMVNSDYVRSWSPIEQLTLVKSALAADPENIELALLLANVRRDRLVEPAFEQRAREADEDLAKFLVKHPNPGPANLALYRYRRKHKLPDAEAALAKALESAPREIEVLLAAAGAAESHPERLVEAADYFRRAIDVAPTDARAYVGLARLLLKQAQTKEGIEVCRKGLKRCGENEPTLNLVLLQGLIQDRNLAEADKLLASIKDKQEAIGPLLKLSERLQLRDAIALLEVELAVAHRSLFRAVAILRRLTLPRSGEHSHADDILARSRRWHRLGQIYEELQYWELAAKAFEEESALGTDKYAALVAAGRAWQAGGRLDAAVASFEAALKATNAQPMGWIHLARAESERQIRRSDRDWEKAENALIESRRVLGDVPAVMMLNVEIQRAKGNRSAAITALASAIASNAAETLPFAVLFYQSLGEDQRAEQALSELKALRRASDPPVRALEVELRRRQKEYDRCKVLLSGLIADAEGTEKYNLQRQLALIELERDEKEGQRQLLALAEQYPESPWAFDRLADLALLTRDYAQLAEFERALEVLEGRDGTLWRFYRAMRIVNDDEQLSQAVRLHNELQALRPLWPSTLQLQGRIAQRQGRVQDAADAYRLAIETGATSMTVFEGLITLLYANNRWLEADAFLSRLQQVGFQSPALEALSSRLLLRQGEFDEAVAAARSGVQRRPRDPLAHIWLGQTLLLASNRLKDTGQQEAMIESAKAAFEHATVLAPEDFRTWSGLLWYSARVGDKQTTARALDGLQTNARLTEPQRALALAQAHQLLGDYQLAEKHYLQAVQLLPDDAATQERLAHFYLAYSPEKAEQAFRRLLELAPASQTTRRALATVLATQGTGRQFDEAIKLLHESTDESNNRRLKAMLLINRGGKDKLSEGRRLLVDLIRQSQTPSATDRHLLALAAEGEGDLALARQQLERLATDRESAVHLAILIEFLLRHDQHTDAAPFVRRLAELEPNALDTTRITARWMKAADFPSQEIKQLVDRYHSQALKSAQDNSQKIATVSAVADLFTQLAMQPEAEDRFRELMQESPGDGARQEFALWLVKNDRLGDAVQLAMEGTSTDVSRASIQLLCNVLAIAAAHGLRFADAELRANELIRERSQDADLLFELATLKHMQGESSAARRLYEQSIQLAPQNVHARNNLAMLLLGEPGADRESLSQIEEALRLGGPTLELRDTYALVLAHQGKFDEACRILRILSSQAPRNPRYLFHLAVAYHKAGSREAAREALDNAGANNLEDEALTPEERRLLGELRRGIEQ